MPQTTPMPSQPMPNGQMGDGQTSNASTGVGTSSAPPGEGFPNNETTADKALSVVDLGEFKGPMSASLYQMFRERHPDWRSDYPISTLEYGLGKRDETGAPVGLTARLVFSGRPITVTLGVDGYIGVRESGANGEQWDSAGGTATIRPDASGTWARVDVTLEYVGVVTKQRRTLTGFFEGQLQRQCYVLYTSPESVGGRTNMDYKIDEDWSSPFCASVKPK